MTQKVASFHANLEAGPISFLCDGIVSRRDWLCFNSSIADEWDVKKLLVIVSRPVYITEGLREVENHMLTQIAWKFAVWPLTVALLEHMRFVPWWSPKKFKPHLLGFDGMYERKCDHKLCPGNPEVVHWLSMFLLEHTIRSFDHWTSSILHIRAYGCQAITVRSKRPKWFLNRENESCQNEPISGKVWIEVMILLYGKMDFYWLDSTCLEGL